MIDGPLNSLTKYEGYSDDRLLKEWGYLTPMTRDPYEAAKQLQEMDEAELAHLYAVCFALAKRVNRR